MQLARNLFLSSEPLWAQAAGGVSLDPDRAHIYQAADFHPLRQPDISRARHLRLRGRRGILFQQTCKGLDASRGGVTRRIAQRPVGVFADLESRQGTPASQPGSSMPCSRTAGSPPGRAAAAREEPLGLEVETDPNAAAPYFVEEVRRELRRSSARTRCIRQVNRSTRSTRSAASCK